MGRLVGLCGVECNRFPDEEKKNYRNVYFQDKITYSDDHIRGVDRSSIAFISDVVSQVATVTVELFSMVVFR